MQVLTCLSSEAARTVVVTPPAHAQIRRPGVGDVGGARTLIGEPNRRAAEWRLKCENFR
jgi:hypothetical protein